MKRATKAERKKHRRLRRKVWSKSTCLVYALRECTGAPISYIGQTRQHPDERLRWHVIDVERRFASGLRLSPVQRWIAELLAEGFVPLIEVIDSNGTWDISEAVWIDRKSADGHPLLNVLSRVPR